MKRHILIFISGLFCLQVQSQITGHFPLICNYAATYGYNNGDSIDYYDPPMSFFWIGEVKVHDGIFGRGNEDYHLRKGFMKNYEIGFTLGQISKNLYQGLAGVSCALQMILHHLSFDHDYMPYRTGDRVAFEPISPSLKSNTLYYWMIRIPVLTGIQTRNRYFSIQTGPSFELRRGGAHEFQIVGEKSDDHRLHVTPLGVNWHVLANAGPLTIAYTQSLIPAFQLDDGTNAYTSSLTVGFNICFFHSVKESKYISKRRTKALELF